MVAEFTVAEFSVAHFTVAQFTVYRCNTSSSAVADRPRDALCPSVVSLNKVITRAESFYYCHLGFRFTTA